MVREYNFRYDSNLVEIIACLQRKKPLFIVIDGRDGAGKTFLGRQINLVLGGTRLTEADYRYYKNEFFNLNIDALNKDLMASIFKPIVLDSCLLHEFMPSFSIEPDMVIYSKALETISGRWEEGEDLYSEQREPEKFRQQMKDYHQRFRPEEKADLTYTHRIIIE